MVNFNKSLAKVNGQLKAAQEDPAKHEKGDSNPAPNLWDSTTFGNWKSALLCELVGSDRRVDSNAGGTPETTRACDPVAVTSPSMPDQFDQKIKDLDNSIKTLASLIQSYFNGHPGSTEPFNDDLNTVWANQELLKTGLSSIKTAQKDLIQIALVIQSLTAPTPPQALPLEAISQSRNLTQTTVFSVSVTNPLTPKSSTQVANVTTTTPKALATVTTATRATSHWEAFTGAIFSTMPNRSFQENPVIVNGFKTNTQIIETKSYPTVVPFASANYRIWEHSMKGRRWGFYGTGGLGINPYTKTVDFGAGMSISYRSLVLSPLAHFARDTRLTQGLYANELLGTSNPPSLTTQQYWRAVFGLAICVRLSDLLTSSSSKSGK